ncbi:membrane bound O-acyl transferase family-domain-containing protein [Hypoxylon rubiginosum]|uniref:Membrane bound O-acyl transferase family-domain-containing protein n=1 Tax=Hypoxylon rubiginosum TaxID=110542 RepID=A0ACC0DBA4_9PEZI|nr:membrane bound O-acyl transferase family-domain-containing protein [Hypoxylon rubiginosum]
MSSSISFPYESLKPSLLFVAAGLLTTIALHFPTKHHRYFLPPTWLLTAWSLASTDSDHTSEGPIGLDSYTAITCIIYMLILPRILFFEQYSLIPGAVDPNKPAKLNSFIIRPTRSSLSAAFRIWNNPRQLSFRRAGPGSAPWPELLKFTLYRIFKVGIIILIDRVLVQKIRAYLTADSTLFDFTADKEPILRRVIEQDEDDPITQHQLVLRAFMSVAWIWANILILESYHAVLSVFFVVVLRFDDPEDWLPLFGSVAEAWTVKRFWGRFWHRIATPTFATWARVVSRRVLKLDPGSEFEKTAVAFGIFLLSGLAHAAAAWRVGQGDAHRDLLFFCANFVVVGVEILVAGLVRGTVRKTRYAALLRDRRLRIAGRALGYVWVFAWFFWATPRWMYSKTLRWSLKQVLLQSRV